MIMRSNHARPLGVGIIGFGRIGAEHAGWLSQSARARAVAVSDATPARRDLAARRGLHAFDTVDALLAEPAVDAVLVATPTSLHREHALAALDAGRHVMIEKPMALSLAEARQIVDRAAAAGRIVSVFHNRRWDEDYLTVAAAMKAGVFGRVFNVESRLGQWQSCVGPAAPEFRPNWRNESAFGGGGLYDWGSHFIDQLWRLVWPARPLRVFAQLRGNVWTNDCDDLARVLIDFSGGLVGMVEINTTTTRPLPRWHIDGTHGSAFSPYSPEFDTSVWASVRFSDADGETHRTLDRAAPGLSPADIWDCFAAAIVEEATPAVTAASVLPTMALLDAARQSSTTGMAVDVADAVEWVL